MDLFVLKYLLFSLWTNNKRKNLLYTHAHTHFYRGYPDSIIVKALDSRIKVNGFELQSRYYVHFQSNTRGKGMNSLILPAMGLIVQLLFFYKGGIGIK